MLYHLCRCISCDPNRTAIVAGNLVIDIESREVVLRGLTCACLPLSNITKDETKIKQQLTSIKGTVRPDWI